MPADGTYEMTAITFLDLPAEIRNEIYRLALELPMSMPVLVLGLCGLQSCPTITNLLLTNKAVYSEASSLLYAETIFDFSKCAVHTAISFIDKCGPRNASYMRHLLIKSPLLSEPFHGDDAFPEDIQELLSKIGHCCLGLHTITMELYSANTMEQLIDSAESPMIISKAIELVDYRLRAIPSLETIKIRLYEVGPTVVRSHMQSRGWLIETHDDDDDAWYFGNDHDINDYDYDDYSPSNISSSAGEYDIDNDSDYWRRAGD
ncbi:hypothetical protein EJ05DRAFT_478582 [Pseudovirgaria hyperparasitica]|uniref:F-box domain-containing protein n=1 Tax=Pseudovirgaria hyperparasitica TaxID=470096 RepID=A0A6A6W0U4_9PEZI|nr:uncharacterized protein EJ05DRAFT_478582 [Pseudovirgaria hyperparasitica]KAF2755604.1 hypothetical protein EJ05DRAFT_478582 [Pseudovirgaria hyperparasitica]